MTLEALVLLFATVAGFFATAAIADWALELFNPIERLVRFVNGTEGK